MVCPTGIIRIQLFSVDVSPEHGRHYLDAGRDTF